MLLGEAIGLKFKRLLVDKSKLVYKGFHAHDIDFLRNLRIRGVLSLLGDGFLEKMIINDVKPCVMSNNVLLKIMYDIICD